jgi:hypothetical protein
MPVMRDVRSSRRRRAASIARGIRNTARAVRSCVPADHRSVERVTDGGWGRRRVGGAVGRQRGDGQIDQPIKATCR